jgi:hypothetical protein
LKPYLSPTWTASHNPVRGEAQRGRQELGRRTNGRINFLMVNHWSPADTERLLAVHSAWLPGNSAVTIEHNLEMIKLQIGSSIRAGRRIRWELWLKAHPNR